MLNSVSQSSGQIDLHMNATYTSFVIGHFLFTIEISTDSALKRRGFFMKHPTPEYVLRNLLLTTRQ